MLTYWEQLRTWLRALVRSGPEPEPSPFVKWPEAVRPRVLLISYDPVIQAAGGRKLSEAMRWKDVDTLCQGYIDDLRECSGGFVDYQIVQKIESEAWPVKEDGFRYDANTFLRCWRDGTGFHQPDTVSYEAVLSEFDLLARVKAGQIDEVWLFGFPYAGFYESRMVGPGAFWCNGPEIPRDDVTRRFVVMGFNYQRGVGEMLEAFGHRTESILKHVWRGVSGEDNLWERFYRYDKIAPGQANVGWMHYAPNSTRDYDWGNHTYVRSNCDDWLNFPDFRSVWRQVNCEEWGNGDVREHHRWWFKHLPKAAGQTRGIANNWWLYAVDPNYAW